MTVTREPADPVGPEVDDELAALEAAAEQARGDARRAAQAVRLARRARGTSAPGTAAEGTEPPGTAASAEDAAADDDAVGDRPPVALTKPAAAVDAPTAIEADDAPTATEADDAPTATEADNAADGPADVTGRRRPRRVTVVAAVAAVLAAAFIVVAGVVHARAGDPASTSPAAARDAALLAARQDIVVLNTLDYTAVDAGLQRWLAATTGTLNNQLSQVTAADKQAIAVSKSRTTASVLAAAVTQVDAARGAATVIASVQVTVTPEGGQATEKRTRFSLTMQRVGSVWKIAAVQQVGVTLS